LLKRTEQLAIWLDSLRELGEFSLEPASGDASFRRYFRVSTKAASYIVMDAPPDKEDTGPFIQVAKALEKIGLNVPHIHAEDRLQGFLLLGDLGSDLYLDRLSDQTVGRLYGDAIESLVTMQANGSIEGLPPYDRNLLMQEMELFRDWLVGRQLNIELMDTEQKMLDETFRMLADSALGQPQVFVHRDYHSRNLMVTEEENPGILDFQDAVVGPVTYDLVSLLKDCYISWPREQVVAWVESYFDLAQQKGLLHSEHQAALIKWFDLMGVQRHLKASGIFARLNQRDGKSGYLKDIPRTLEYILQISTDYPSLEGLADLLRNRVMPAIQSSPAFFI
jgi:aminoglycoside/choline kinase family phosphotransferase